MKDEARAADKNKANAKAEPKTGQNSECKAGP